MTDTEFENLVDDLFRLHAGEVGASTWHGGDDGLDAYTVHDFARDLRDRLDAARTKETKP